MVDNQSLLNEFFLVSWFKVFLDLDQIFLYFINFLFNIAILDREPLKESEEILRLNYPITILVKESEDPKVDKL